MKKLLFLSLFVAQLTFADWSTTEEYLKKKKDFS